MGQYNLVSRNISNVGEKIFWTLLCATPRWRIWATRVGKKTKTFFFYFRVAHSIKINSECYEIKVGTMRVKLFFMRKDPAIEIQCQSSVSTVTFPHRYEVNSCPRWEGERCAWGPLSYSTFHSPWFRLISLVEYPTSHGLSSEVEVERERDWGSGPRHGLL